MIKVIGYQEVKLSHNGLEKEAALAFLKKFPKAYDVTVDGVPLRFVCRDCHDPILENDHRSFKGSEQFGLCPDCFNNRLK